jgi:putative transposase
MNAIFYIARTGCQWKALPRSFGASSTVHDRFQEWRQDGVFKRMLIDGLKISDKKLVLTGNGNHIISNANI